MPVLGVIKPGARAAHRHRGDGPIGVIGTAGTIASNAYNRAIQALAPGAAVMQRACPLFVPLVEEGWFDHPATELIATEYLRELRRCLVRVTGAGLYPLSATQAAAAASHGAGGQAHRQRPGHRGRVSETMLVDRALDAPAEAEPSHRFVVSDDEARFRQVGSRFIGERLGKAEVVPLGTEPA